MLKKFVTFYKHLVSKVSVSTFCSKSRNVNVLSRKILVKVWKIWSRIQLW